MCLNVKFNSAQVQANYSFLSSQPISLLVLLLVFLLILASVLLSQLTFVDHGRLLALYGFCDDLLSVFCLSYEEILVNCLLSQAAEFVALEESGSIHLYRDSRSHAKPVLALR